jgi:hypothetical protein
LYDVSGLKLKSSYPSVSHETSNQVAIKYSNNDDYASSESSQGLFEKELSNEKGYLSNGEGDFVRDEVKEEPVREMKRNYSQSGGYGYDLNAFRKERVQEFSDVPEP